MTCPTISKRVLASLVLLIAYCLGQTYDYVIAGGGTAGLLLAVALTENPNISVAVLEAGGDGRKDARITVPEKQGSIVNTDYDWKLETIPQSGLVNSKMQPVSKGKVLGGTSAMNYLILNRASKIELDAWDDILGNDGWNWSSLFAASKASEHFLPPTSSVPAATYNTAFHGNSGPIFSMMQRNTSTLYTQYLLPALRSLGVPVPVDKDGGDSTGAGPEPLSINRDSYTRSYSGSAYTAAQSRSNLHVFTNCTVRRIAFDQSTTDGLQVAKGVRYRNETAGGTANALLLARNVVLSAGSIQTPQLLEISGLGDPAVLAEFNIEPLVDLPAVGAGLQDKPTYTGSWSFNTSGFTGTQYVQTFLDYATPSRLLSAQDLVMLKQLANSAKPSSGMSQAAISILKHVVDTDQPVIEFGFFLGYVNTYLLHPLSTGSVHINSADPMLPPVIDPGYNTALINGTSIDLWLLSKAISYLTKTLAIAPPFAKINATFSVPRSLNQAQIQDRVHQGMGIGQHWTGGARMLPRDAGGVVDTDLLVYGTKNVRVVDASVIPAVPGQHPMGLIYAIAMRAAGIIAAG